MKLLHPAIFTVLSLATGQAFAADGQGSATFDPDAYISGGSADNVVTGGGGEDRDFTIPPEDEAALVKWISKLPGCPTGGGKCKLGEKLYDAYHEGGAAYHDNLGNDSTNQKEEQSYIDSLIEKDNKRKE